MLEEYVQKSWELLKKFRRITPHLIARKFKLTLEFANKICHQVWLRQHKEARALAAQLDNCGFPSQLQKSADRKNLDKFKGKREKS